MQIFRSTDALLDERHRQNADEQGGDDRVEKVEQRQWQRIETVDDLKELLLAAVRFRADHDRLVGGDDAFVGRIRVELEETRCTRAETRRHSVVINRGEVAVDDERASRRGDIGM